MPLDVPPPRTSRFGSPLVLSRVHWVQPELVAEVKYLTWTDENLLRQVVYEGLREDKPAAEVRRRPPHPKPAAAAPPPTPSKRQRSKRLPVPAENILQLLPNAVVPSREELCAYWETVADDALAYLGRRPLKLVRHIKGTTGASWDPIDRGSPATTNVRLGQQCGRVQTDAMFRERGRRERLTPPASLLCADRRNKCLRTRRGSSAPPNNRPSYRGYSKSLCRPTAC